MLRLIICALLLSGCVAIPVASPSSPGEDVEARIEPDPTSYTVGFVDTAISFYIENGRERTVEYFCTEESMLDQWYVFIVDAQSGKTISHPDPIYIGYDTAGSVDVTGYAHGAEIMSADEDGKWVSYVWMNPITNDLHQKHTWAIRYDGLIFASGWYEEEVIAVNQ